MRLISTDVPGPVTATSITTLLTTAGYTLTHPPLAYGMYLVENTQGTTAARLGGPDVSASKGIPFAAVGDKIALLPILGVGGAPSRIWNMDIHYLYIPSGDTVSISAWVD